MPFRLRDFSTVHRALNAISGIHGSYRAVELLGKALDQVQVPEEFDEKLKEWAAQHGGAYEGPTDTTRNVVKGLHTAADTNDADDRNALVELLAMVLSKLTVSQGTRILSIMLASAGWHPRALLLTIRVCALAAQTRAGRRIVESFQPRLQEAVAAASDKSQLIEPLKELAATIGDKGKQFLASATSVAASAAKAPLDAAKNLADAGITFLDQLRPTDEKKGK